MQNIDIKEVIGNAMMHCGWSPKVLQGYVALQDVAEIARLVILDPAQHNLARYELVGENITLEQVARTIAQCAGKPPFPCKQVTREVLFEKSVSPAQGEYFRDGLDRMLYYYDKKYVGSPILFGTLRPDSEFCS